MILLNEQNVMQTLVLQYEQKALLRSHFPLIFSIYAPLVGKRRVAEAILNWYKLFNSGSLNFPAHEHAYTLIVILDWLCESEFRTNIIDVGNFLLQSTNFVSKVPISSETMNDHAWNHVSDVNSEVRTVKNGRLLIQNQKSKTWVESWDSWEHGAWELGACWESWELGRIFRFG